MDSLLKGLGLVLYILMFPLFAITEIMISFVKYTAKEIMTMICFVKTKVNPTLSKSGFQNKGEIKNSNFGFQ